MRTSLVGVALILVPVFLTPTATAQPTALHLELLAPEVIRPGDRVSLRLVVTPAGEEAMLITPTSEGAAVVVARGRLQRRDGAVDGDSLVVQVPIIAQHAGHALVRVHVETYACEGERCRAIEADTSVALDVVRAP
ncbi:MAG: hypothetical protein AB8H86_12135 [Polyangiales bacterium]